MNKICERENVAHEDIAGVILAGGRGQRMGGIEKGMATLAGRPMIAHVIAALAPQVAEIVISANTQLDRYRQLGYRVIPDSDFAHQGPLAGLACALAATDKPYVAVVACDMPLLATDFVERLAGVLISAGADVCVAHDGERAHYTALLLRRDVRENLIDYLAGGERKVGRWLAQQRLSTADFSHCANSLTNVNDWTTLKTIESALPQGVAA